MLGACNVFALIWKETGSGNVSKMDLHDLLDWHVGNDAWFDAGNGAGG